MRVYLAGAINGCSDSEAKDWRGAARVMLETFGAVVVDPMARDYRGRELEPGIAAEIVENDKADINGCTDMLVYTVKPSWGTAMEILYAWERGIRVTVIDKSDAPVSPWLLYHSANRWPSQASGAPPNPPRIYRSISDAVAAVANRTLPTGAVLQCPFCGEETHCANLRCNAV